MSRKIINMKMTITPGILVILALIFIVVGYLGGANTISFFKEELPQNELNVGTQFKSENESKEMFLKQTENSFDTRLEVTSIGLFLTIFIGLSIALLVYLFKRFFKLLKKRNFSWNIHLKTKNKKAQKFDLFKQEMLSSMIVHDLKNPLSIILNTDDINLIKQAAAQMLNMVLNILDVNKYMNTKVSVEIETFHLNQNLQKAIAQVAFISKRKFLLIENKIDAEIQVRANPQIVERILVNLLSNAVKYTPANGYIEINANIDTKKERVIISVQDTGRGIPKEYQHKIFSNGVIPDFKITNDSSSTGLGLWFCELAVEALDGNIWIDESYTNGTCISFTLPLYFNKEEAGLERQLEFLNSIKLTLQEKKIFQKYFPQFEDFQIYEISAYRKVFKMMENEEQVNRTMLNKLREAVDNGNEKLFKALVNYIKYKGEYNNEEIFNADYR